MKKRQGLVREERQVRTGEEGHAGPELTRAMQYDGFGH